jgi:hypothetical protein
MTLNPEAAQLVLGEIALAGISPEQEQLLQRLESRRITPDLELPQLEFLFRMKKPCFARGELTAVSGKAKSGKTFVCSVLMTLCFQRQVLSLERNDDQAPVAGPSSISHLPSDIAPLKVLWYDTEQSEESTQDILKNRILPMAGIRESEFPADRFQIFNVRGESYSDRLKMLEVAVPRYKPDLVILDGIRDLVSDINDGVVAQDVVERLMHLASDNRCAIVCVLHQNKSVEDKNLRGWIGTELKNKAFEVYECAKSAERIFTWSQTDTRKYDIPDKVQFSVDENGIPYLCTPEQLLEAQYEAQRKATEQMQRQGRASNKYPEFNPKYMIGKQGHKHIFDVKLLFGDAMTPGTIYSEDALKKQVKLLSNIMKDDIYHETLQKALDEKVIFQSYDGSGHRIYVRNAQTSLPW